MISIKNSDVTELPGHSIDKTGAHEYTGNRRQVFLCHKHGTYN